MPFQNYHQNGNVNTNENDVFFSSNSNMEFLSTWKNLNLYAFIRWAGVNPDSYLKESKKRIETKKRVQMGNEKESE